MFLSFFITPPPPNAMPQAWVKIAKYVVLNACKLVIALTDCIVWWNLFNLDIQFFISTLNFIFIFYNSAKLSKNYELHTAHYEPHAAHYEPHTAHYEPHTAHYEPHTAHYEPHTAHYEPHTAHYEPHTLYLKTLFCYKEWYIFKLYVHFVGIISNYCFDFCISKWEPTFWTKHKYSKVWNF